MFRSASLSIIFFPFFFFFNDTATTEIYTLSLHDALPISRRRCHGQAPGGARRHHRDGRSEEHTSELQSLTNLVCRLLLEKKKKTQSQLPRPKNKRNKQWIQAPSKT